MIKIILSMFLISNIANSQNITISDINFKNKLLESDTTNSIARDINENNIKIDINNDGEIQQSEASNVSRIDLDGAFERSNINNLDGIEDFINLKELLTYEVYITSFDFDLPKLETLDLSYCSITDLDLGKCPILENLTFYSKNDELETINLQNGSPISNLSISDSPNLSNVCVDSSELSFVTSLLSSNVSVSANCTLKNKNIYFSDYELTYNQDKISINSDLKVTKINIITITGNVFIYYQPKSINTETYSNGFYLLEILFENGQIDRKKIFIK